MKRFTLSTTLVAAGLLMAVPAFAQTTMGGTAAQKQHTDGGDSPSDPRATDAASAAWHKQHIDGGDSPSDPRATDASAAAWRKQHIDATVSPSKQPTQSLSHEDPGSALDKSH